MASSTKALTVRLPEDLYAATVSIARRRKTSVDALVREGLTALLEDEQYAELHDAFGQLGADADEADVEFARDAQWEVVSRDDHEPVSG